MNADEDGNVIPEVKAPDDLFKDETPEPEFSNMFKKAAGYTRKKASLGGNMDTSFDQGEAHGSVDESECVNEKVLNRFQSKSRPRQTFLSGKLSSLVSKHRESMNFEEDIVDESVVETAPNPYQDEEDAMKADKGSHAWNWTVAKLISEDEKDEKRRRKADIKEKAAEDKAKQASVSEKSRKCVQQENESRSLPQGTDIISSKRQYQEKVESNNAFDFDSNEKEDKVKKTKPAPRKRATTDDGDENKDIVRKTKPAPRKKSITDDGDENEDIVRKSKPASRKKAIRDDGDENEDIIKKTKPASRKRATTDDDDESEDIVRKTKPVTRKRAIRDDGDENGDVDYKPDNDGLQSGPAETVPKKRVARKPAKGKQKTENTGPVITADTEGNSKLTSDSHSQQILKVIANLLLTLIHSRY